MSLPRICVDLSVDTEAKEDDGWHQEAAPLTETISLLQVSSHATTMQCRVVECYMQVKPVS